MSSFSWENYGQAKRLYRLLDKAEGCLEDFAFSKSFQVAPNPGLNVAGIGLIRLPVSPENAEKLYTSSTASAGVAEIQDDKIELRNPTWNTWIRGVTDTITPGLGLDETKMQIVSTLEKLIVYKSDAMHNTATLDWPKQKADENSDVFGFFEVSLPSNFEGGPVPLVCGNERKTAALGENPLFDVTIAAWHARQDVKHVTAQVSQGYKVTLVYNLRTKTQFRGPAAQMKDAADLIHALRKLKATNEPVAYVLADNYSDSDSRVDPQSFKGKDRLIVRNLVQAAQKVCGLSVYCGDLVTRDTYEKPAYHGYRGYGYEGSETSADPVGIDEFDYRNQHINDLSHTLECMVHLVGPTRVFATGNDEEHWDGPILTFGSYLSDLEPYDTEHEGDEYEEDYVEIERCYRSSCLVIYPTSPMQALEEQTKSDNIRWKPIKEILDTCEKGQIDESFRTTLCTAIFKGCLKRKFTDSETVEAGKVMKEVLEKLPSCKKDGIFQNYLYLIFGPGGSVYSVQAQKSWQLSERRMAGSLNGSDLYSLLIQISKLMNTLPVSPKTHFYPMLEDIVSQPAFIDNGFAPLVRSIFDVLKWQPEEFLLKLLRLVFIANPSENLRLQIEEDMKKSLSSDSPHLRIWESISRKSHGFIIEGIKERATALVSENQKAVPGSFKQVVGYRIPTPQPRKPPPGLSPDSDPSSDSGEKATTDQGPNEFILPHLAQLRDYLLRIQSQPDATSLTAQFLDALQLPDLRSSPVYDLSHFYDSDLNYVAIDVAALLPIAKEVHKLYWSSQAPQTQSAALEKFLGYFKRIVFMAHSCVKPPNLVNSLLPPFSQQPCPKRGCILCPPLDEFLVSPTAQRFQMESCHGFKTHFKEVHSKLNNYTAKGMITYNIGTRTTNGNAVLEIDKRVRAQYEAMMKIFVRDVAERKRILNHIGITIGNDGTILSEPSYLSPDTGGNSRKKRKASRSVD
ncbi:hypothetical protein TWF696_001345 [Orbilia brochopaga]|uniref:Uncharacterized protein n=1 Tax=Orbilia brochopaga TaxID=3140254 RepID=A0AAV9UCC2_9PEZI